MTDVFVAPALLTLRDNIDAAYPHRDHASDGFIGDPSHAARKSDHNPDWSAPDPDTGIVRAGDFDIRPDGDPDTDLRVAILEATIGDDRVWYVISNGRIYSRTYGWEARVYTGDSAHTEHVHVSLRGADGIPAAMAHDLNHDTTPWMGDGKPPTNPRPPAIRFCRIVAAARAPGREVAPINVRRVQRALNIAGYPTAVDGVYGPRTRTALRGYQRAQGIPARDATGAPTWESISALTAGQYRLLACTPG